MMKIKMFTLRYYYYYYYRACLNPYSKNKCLILNILYANILHLQKVEEGYVNTKKAAVGALGALAEHCSSAFGPYVKVTNTLYGHLKFLLHTIVPKFEKTNSLSYFF